MESLFVILSDDWEDEELDLRREFAIAILAHCSRRSIVTATETLIILTADCPFSAVRRAVVSWLGGALWQVARPTIATRLVAALVYAAQVCGSHADTVVPSIVNELRLAIGGPSSRAVFDALAKIARKIRSTAVGLTVVETLGELASLPGAQHARLATRSLVTLAKGSGASRDMLRAVGRRLVEIVLHGDDTNARIAIRGLCEASAHDAGLCELSWDAFATARRRLTSPASTAALERALEDLMRLREEQLQEENEHPAAKQIAPAA